MSDYSSVSARTVRAALKACGLEHTIEKVSSGKSYTRFTLHTEHQDQHEAVLAVLRNLWDDGQYRVDETITGYIWINRGHYWMTKHGSHRHPAALVQRFTELQRAYLIWQARGAGAGMYPKEISADEVRDLRDQKLIGLFIDRFQITEDGLKIYRELMGL